jgi:hypothetical protein
VARGGGVGPPTTLGVLALDVPEAWLGSEFPEVLGCFPFASFLVHGVVPCHGVSGLCGLLHAHTTVERRISLFSSLLSSPLLFSSLLSSSLLFSSIPFSFLFSPLFFFLLLC